MSLEPLCYEKIVVSVPYGTKKKIETIINKHPKRFSSISHYVRCALIRFDKMNR